jgi:hypothetical protein
MSKNQRLCAAILAVLSVFWVLAAAMAVAKEGDKVRMSAADLKRLGTFLSNFTEQGFWNVSRADISREDQIRFGVRHNYINNFKTRVKQCKVKGCEYGALVIDPKHVSESVKKYFNINLTKHDSVADADPPIHYDGKLYHFEGADGDVTYYARVSEVLESDKPNELLVRGLLYDVENPDEPGGPYEVMVKPYKYGGANTWSLEWIQVETGEGDEMSEMPEEAEKSLAGVLLISESIVPTDTPVKRLVKYDGAESVDGTDFFQFTVYADSPERLERLGTFRKKAGSETYYFYEVVGDEYKRIVIGDAKIFISDKAE